MSDFNLFEQMLDDFLPEEKKSGDVIEGVLVRKEMDYAYLDLNSKKEGRIIAKEVEEYNIGDVVEVRVLRNEEDVVIVSKFLLDKAKEFASYEEGEIVSGIVDKKIKGGYNVKIGKNEGFLPFSLSSFDRNADYTGQKFKFLLKEKSKNNIMLSRVDLVKKEEEEFFTKINVGDVITGKVKEVLDFGVVLDFEVTNGFIHISEVAWEQVNDLVEKFGINDEVTAKVIEKDEEKRKIKLSIKQLTEDPFNLFVANKNVGDVVKATVREILDFGLIVDVDKNKGFIHISELAWNNNSKEINNYKENDVIEAKIISIENENKNIKLSVKQLTENPFEVAKQKYQIGEILEREIAEIFEFGLLFELEKDVEGLLHISDLSYRRVGNLSSKYKVGDVVKFKIVEFNDAKNRVTLSAKALEDDAWENLDINIGDIVSGKVTSIQEYGLFVEVEKGIEALIHRNELAWDKSEEKSYNVDDVVEFKVINIEKGEKKLGGSIKQLTISPLKEALEQYKVGNKVVVPITSIQENYVLVKLTERFNGVVPKRELTKDFLKDISEKFAIGDEIEAVVIETNEKRKSIVLSAKKVTEIEEKSEMDELMKIYGV